MNIVIPGANIFAAVRGFSTVQPLRTRIFALLWTTGLISNFGYMIQSVGAQWHMTSIAPSADMVALVQTAITLPILLFSLPAGALADILNRRRVLIAAQLVMLAASTVMAALAYLQMLGPWTLLAVTFVLGVGAALYGPSWQASAGDLVVRDQIPAAVALNSLGFNIARAAGPALGGVIVATAGPEAAFAINAVSYIGLIGALIVWKPVYPERTLPPEDMVPAMAAGLRYAGHSPSIRAVLLRALAFGMAGSAVWALLPLVARDIIGGGPVVFGTLLGALGAGAIVGAFTATPVRARIGAERQVLGATVAFGAAMIATAAVPAHAVAMLCLTVAGAAWVMALSTFNVNVQLSSPRWVMGRTISVYQMLIFGGMALGSWLWGVLAQGAGVGAAIIAAGIAMFASLALTRALRLVGPAASGGLEPSGHWPEPEVSLDIDPESGPVVIAVEYRIPHARTPAFLSAMRAMRRIRRRDGARRWALIQDVAEPELWTERYESPSWLDHMRQHVRATASDAEVDARIAALHEGPEPPLTRHFIARPLIGDGAAKRLGLSR